MGRVEGILKPPTYASVRYNKLPIWYQKYFVFDEGSQTVYLKVRGQCYPIATDNNQHLLAGRYYAGAFQTPNDRMFLGIDYMIDLLAVLAPTCVGNMTIAAFQHDDIVLCCFSPAFENEADAISMALAAGNIDLSGSKQQRVTALKDYIKEVRESHWTDLRMGRLAEPAPC